MFKRQFLLTILVISAGRVVGYCAESQQGTSGAGGAAAPTQNQLSYTNTAAGYAVSYPSNWFWVQPYRNAFELRNHDAQHSVPRQNEASILFTEEQMITSEQAERRLTDLMDAASAGKGFYYEKLRIDGRDFYQWTVLQKAAVLAKTNNQAVAPSDMRTRVGSVLLGTQLIRAEGNTWANADPKVVAQIKEIERSIRLITASNQKGNTNENK